MYASLQCYGNVVVTSQCYGSWRQFLGGGGGASLLISELSDIQYTLLQCAYRNYKVQRGYRRVAWDRRSPLNLPRSTYSRILDTE